MAATLNIRRETNGIELRRGRFEIAVDGEQVGTIESRETVERPLEPGHHTLLVRKGRYSSRARSFDATDGEVVSFRCHSAIFWPRYLASMLKPDLAIKVTAE